MSRIVMFALAAGLSMPGASQQTDADFMKKAADAGIVEVEVGRLAMEKASNADVKAYARTVVVDQARANEQLLKMSQSRNVSLNAEALKVDLTLPLTSDKGAMQPTTTQLMALEGAAFDRAFLDQVVKDHQQAIDLFDEEADKGKDKELRDWAEKVHQTLQDHLKLAKDLQEKIKPPQVP